MADRQTKPPFSKGGFVLFIFSFSKTDQRYFKRYGEVIAAHHMSHVRYTLYVLDDVDPPRPVQSVWKNSPRGLSIRS